MVGHTGQIGAAIRMQRLLMQDWAKYSGAKKAQNGKAIITADHGNAEQMLD